MNREAKQVEHIEQVKLIECIKKRKILFQGDSITDGNRGRDEDPNHILGHGYAFWIAAELGHRLASGQPEFVNRGISGNRVQDLEERWREDALELQPDTISILVGVNDILMSIAEPDGFDPQDYEASYRRLLKRTRQELPEVQLVLCEPFILPGGHTDYDWSAWKAAANACAEIVRRLADEYDAVFVPLQDAFDDACELAPASYWIWDGIHPTTAGHGLLAKRWLEVVQESQVLIR
ncbi:SGNH/GDSL hydrolase family protein [Saccharibacillus kuerlensis]|uniref:Lipase n=1 Tax=Saccharibacillus kuerlensis TaxID=459527 RepID=A0ABQ2KZX4_9BACL|nr:SGNH/GDSL hydrolase family protein [Saccharibacillus kuerlensis]GGN98236.1 lipase [Saccharibacillus kuerlensis]